MNGPEDIGRETLTPVVCRILDHDAVEILEDEGTGNNDGDQCQHHNAQTNFCFLAHACYSSFMEIV
jgi:hypothetical protein